MVTSNRRVCAALLTVCQFLSFTGCSVEMHSGGIGGNTNDDDVEYFDNGDLPTPGIREEGRLTQGNQTQTEQPGNPQHVSREPGD